MRLWSIHPRYLDQKGLIALWREALLARAVLLGETKGYRNHPQLNRFRQARNPILAINNYLFYTFVEAKKRGYSFNESKLDGSKYHEKIPVTRGQIEFEFSHLKRKCGVRSPWMAEKLDIVEVIEPHPLFYVIEGGVESWERK